MDIPLKIDNPGSEADWKRCAVLQAKNILVWLWQLSGRYNRGISRLDQIPDQELDYLAFQGVTILWLIGIWERSPASKTINELCGRVSQEASAYAVVRYDVAQNLGGEPAWRVLRDKLYERGIRLCGDFIPNHTAIDSDWVKNAPERFLSRNDSPYPAYTFNGRNLNEAPGPQIRLEDHYFDESDAAVVFQYRADAEADPVYLYHGNDGTMVPWNDTAQLDLTNSEVRTALIETALDIAAKFPVIRLDSAMTLLNRHIHRLWYPESEADLAVPSRGDYSLTAEQFKKKIPTEFWQEFAAAFAKQAPDALLIAESFWDSEACFLETIGLHRVYNGRFRHQLLNTDEPYRDTFRTYLAENPSRLQGLLNYLSNPDGDSAVSGFGTEERYFGSCALMSVLPGTPMFAHGQFEGLREKYGMAFSRPTQSEKPDQNVLSRHEREIMPLLRLRSRFNSVENFQLFVTNNPQVIAFLNGTQIEWYCFAYNNSPNTIHTVLQRFEEKGDEDPGRLGDLFIKPGIRRILFIDQATYDALAIPVRILKRKGLEISLAPYRYRLFRGFVAISPELKRFARRFRTGVCRRLENIVQFHASPSILERMTEGAYMEAYIRYTMKSDAPTMEQQQVFPNTVGNTIRAVARILQTPHPDLHRYIRNSLRINPGASFQLALFIHLYPLARLRERFPSDELHFLLYKSELSGSEKQKAENILRLMLKSAYFEKETDYLQLFRDPLVYDILEVNMHANHLWFNKERFLEVLWWICFSQLFYMNSAEKALTDVVLLTQIMESSEFLYTRLMNGIRNERNMKK